MTQTRRDFLVSAATTGAVTLLPYGARAEEGGPDVFKAAGGEIAVHPVSHASFVMETPVGTIYCDPVGDTGAYAGFPRPELILVTHRHGDHYSPETLTALAADRTPIITCPDVLGMMPDHLAGMSQVIGNGEATDWRDVGIDAIPAHNLTEERMNFHPKGRDNGYVLSFEGFRVYISGDTEDVPEMRALRDIDLAFVCMNLPFTMAAEAAASAVAEFKPRFVYPYHYRGRDGGTQDPAAFANLVPAATTVRLVDWYPDNPDL
ncbi:MBL fold metallo-hydrolase [Maritimibacter sp. 55A14]|uniref:MBL fold metallo-hydrolase n=1 Tax=Maritimibacter sp. 55A14 TaxID=2174844 RepID=UPI000D60B868|nr:MBL fold metallo-hydrolase [Maritimibacter sp. 55A14]PWE31387.1 MBL fold metallo-hydrolase [Maritimibacter sp. 55A14]